MFQIRIAVCLLSFCPVVIYIYTYIYIYILSRFDTYILSVCVQMDYAFELPYLKNGEPSNRFRKCDFSTDDCVKTKTTKVEWSPSELDIILEHIESPYADVRAPGWETLALITETKSVAQSLLDRKIGGRDALTEIQSRVDQSKDVNTSFVSHDQNRFILKTIKNMMRVIESEK